MGLVNYNFADQTASCTTMYIYYIHGFNIDDDHKAIINIISDHEICFYIVQYVVIPRA